MLHLHLIPESPPGGPHWACAEIRLLRPYGHPSLQDRVQTSVGAGLPSGRIDAVVTQRGGPGAATLDDVIDLVRQVRRRGLPLIYDIDDDLLAEHPYDWVEKAIAPNRPRVRFLLEEADVVTVSTEALAERARRFNPNVHVWRNALDERLIAPRAAADEEEEGADLGYFGTASHLDDLLSVVESLQRGLAGLGGKATVEICGVDENARAAQLFAHFGRVDTVPTTHSYARFMQGFQQRPSWKSGIAPLTDRGFNSAKSDIKFLDYALFGIPAVYAKGSVYTEVEHGQTGLLAGPDDWGPMVRSLIDDPGLRRRIRKGARDHLMQHRILARRAPDLFNIIDGQL